MKSLTVAALALLPLTAMTARSEEPAAGKMYKVVFEVVADGAEKWLGALRNVENAQESLGAATR